MRNINWTIPQEVVKETLKYFHPSVVTDAQQHLLTSRVSISFTKGTPETYFIVSGMVRGDRIFECKSVFKKRLIDTELGPISTNCDCHEWTAKGHCSHAASLFLNYHLEIFRDNHQASLSSSEIGDTQEHRAHPPISINTSFGVNVEEYGTIVKGPRFLVGASNNGSYSSMQYLLHNKKVINFPAPSPFRGKLIVCLTSVNPQTVIDNPYHEVEPFLFFKYRNEDDKLFEEVSLLENLYLFNWISGEAYNLPRSIKSFIHKIRIRLATLDINEVIRMFQEAESSENMNMQINHTPLEQIPRNEPESRIVIVTAKKKSQMEIGIVFHNSHDKVIRPPHFLSTMTFSGGLLSSFKKKRDAYNFFEDLFHSSADEPGLFKKNLVYSNKKSQISDLISFLLTHETTEIYDPEFNEVNVFQNHFLLYLFKCLFKNFGENFFRLSSYDFETRQINYLLGSNALLDGISNFHNQMSTYPVTIFYNKKTLSSWKSRIRFERKSVSTNWFDLELNISKEDLKIIQNTDPDTGIALTNDGLVLLDKDQKDLLKFMKKYVNFEAQKVDKNPLDENGDPLPGTLEGYVEVRCEDGEIIDPSEEMEKFVLPMKRSRIFELFELKKLGITGALTPEEEALCEKLANLTEIPKYDIPETLKGVMRPYQETGFHWLNFLYESRMGACLADDMGLGKTLQTIAFVQSILEKCKKILIVCPVSILLNWEKEFTKFSSLSVLIYHGGTRDIDSSEKIILTSYGVMKREIETTFKDIEFDVLILDEVQHLKNIRSQGAFAARQLNADFRICLTGTPVENDLAEFYNIIDLSIPGIWGDLGFIRKNSNKRSRLLAKKTASPFILRRTKSQVLTELPPKIENNVYLSFEDEEDNFYKNTLEKIKHGILNSSKKHKYGEILKGLLKLRQSCLWQTKGPLDISKLNSITSTKVNFLLETLDQIMEEGHQTLIFSQFTTYLDIIQKHFDERRWKFSRIDGSMNVKKRQSQVDLFQAGDNKLFLISLKAGGVGLNLTAASYVFIMDPWWNPAVESQAIDRAHRIGQKNTLTVYRPLIKDSVEEKVLKLQETKKELFKDLLSDDTEDGELFSGKLTMKDFEDLLS